MLSDNEDGDIVAEFLKEIKKWCMGTWKLRYFLTHNSAAEQRAVTIAFPGLAAGEQEVDHFLCRKHSERTRDRKLAEARNKAAKGTCIKLYIFDIVL